MHGGPAQAFATRTVHAGAAPDPATGARVMPIYQSNGFVFDDVAHGADLFNLKRAGFAYARGSNPNTAALERRIADLEGGTGAIAVASGQSAWMLVLLTLLESGDHYVGSTRLFGGSLALMRRMEKRLKLHVQWADPTPEAIEAAITPQTKAIVIESIVNPTGEVADLAGIAAVATRHKLPLVVDNTLASPALLRPIEHGADIVIHSASKFIGGHGQAIGGVIVDAGRFPWRDDARFPLISEPWEEYDGLMLMDAFPASAFTVACRLTGMREYGPGMAPHIASMLLTGVETLALRMEKHCANADTVAAFLAGHKAIESVSYPGLPGHPNNAVALHYCPDGVGAVFVATLNGGEAAATVAISRLKLFSHLVNIGETRSLVAHPATTTHRTLPERERAALGINGGTIRISVGIEDVEDLVADLAQALAAPG